MFSRTYTIYGAVALFLLLAVGTVAYAQAASREVGASTLSDQNHHAVTFWLQTLDSCREAVGGARYLLQGNGLSLVQESTPAEEPETVQSDTPCSEERGNCEVVSIGCIAWHIPLPASGERSYHITELEAPTGYLPCMGSESCTEGPAYVMLTLTSSGEIRATSYNSSQSGASYTGTESNPIVVHNAMPSKKIAPPASSPAKPFVTHEGSPPSGEQEKPPVTHEGNPPSSNERKPPVTYEGGPPVNSQRRPPVQLLVPPRTIPGMPFTGSDPASTY